MILHYRENSYSLGEHFSERETFELAAENSLWETTPEQWEKYIKARNASIDNLCENRMDETIKIIDDFLKDASVIYENITVNKG